MVETSGEVTIFAFLESPGVEVLACVVIFHLVGIGEGSLLVFLERRGVVLLDCGVLILLLGGVLAGVLFSLVFLTCS